MPDDKGKPSLHAHTVLGRSDGSTRGGHLIEGHVRPTLEITVTELPAHLKRHKHPELGVALIETGLDRPFVDAIGLVGHAAHHLDHMAHAVVARQDPGQFARR